MRLAEEQVPIVRYPARLHSAVFVADVARQHDVTCRITFGQPRSQALFLLCLREAEKREPRIEVEIRCTRKFQIEFYWLLRFGNCSGIRSTDCLFQQLFISSMQLRNQARRV